MLCQVPYRQGVQEFGCGQCMPCRINRRRQWVSRIMLESYGHAADRQCFVTLTFAPDRYPADGSLRKSDLQLFFKRLRKRVGAVRYFAVGEYGGVGGRAHYHIALFGTQDVGALGLAWTQGFVHVGELNEKSAGYLAGYIAKGMTRAESEGLGGRCPEFAIMSRRPGLGANAAVAFAQAATTRGGASQVAGTGDVAAGYRVGGRIWPLGRYMRRKIRGELGMDLGTPEGCLSQAARDLAFDLRQPGAVERRELVRRFAVALTSGAVFDQSIKQTADAVWIVAQAMVDAEPGNSGHEI